MLVKVFEFGALVLVGLCLMPAGAHFFEMWGKLALDKDAYFSLQRIYNGWALFGVVIAGAILATGVLAWLIRDAGLGAWLAGISAALLIGSLVVFFLRIYPMNVATKNWTVVPDNWQPLRAQWETGHAINALLTFAAFAALSLAVVLRR
jgi:hypothetical protein